MGIKEESTTLPLYTWKEVNRHNTPESCWIVVKGHVYDVTDYLLRHPGGMDRILFAASGPIISPDKYCTFLHCLVNYTPRFPN